MKIEAKKKWVSGKFQLGRSSFALVDHASLEQAADYLSQLAIDLGFHPIRVPSTAIQKIKNPETNPIKEIIFITVLRNVPNERTARFLKHVADDFRKNRAGIVLPDGEVIQWQLPIHCSWVVTTVDILRQWGKGSYRVIPDYYSVMET